MNRIGFGGLLGVFVFYDIRHSDHGLEIYLFVEKLIVFFEWVTVENFKDLIDFFNDGFFTIEKIILK